MSSNPQPQNSRRKDTTTSQACTRPRGAEARGPRDHENQPTETHAGRLGASKGVCDRSQRTGNARLEQDPTRTPRNGTQLLKHRTQKVRRRVTRRFVTNADVGRSEATPTAHGRRPHRLSPVCARSRDGLENGLKRENPNRTHASDHLCGIAASECTFDKTQSAVRRDGGEAETSLRRKTHPRGTAPKHPPGGGPAAHGRRHGIAHARPKART